MDVELYERIESIEELWKNLTGQASTLTFFQSYEWNLCLEKRFRALHWLKYSNCSLIYVVCDNILIAPLIVDKKSKCISILGHDEASDYLTFIHGAASTELLKKYILAIMKKYEGYTFKLSKINEVFPMHLAVDELLIKGVTCLESHTSACVYISTDFEKSIYDCMSKSKRQNYRTSLNRLEKDGHVYKIETNFDIIADKRSYYLYKLYYQRRYDSDEKLPGLFSQIYAKIRYLFGISIWGNCQDVLSNYAKIAPVFLSSIFIDDHLAAFCEGGYSYDKRRICIGRVATNSYYYKYSPGMILLINTIDSIKDQVDYFDLTRGTESYKSDLNGVKHMNYSYTLRV